MDHKIKKEGSRSMNMWHLKTRQGTFWVAETPGTAKQEYHLGINDSELGTYENPNVAVKDVCEQMTGYFPWDCQSTISVPSEISHWTEGQPENW